MLAIVGLSRAVPARHCGDMTTQQQPTAGSNGAQWGFPDSEICSAAFSLVFDVAPTFLANHCARSYLFGRELAAVKGLRSGVDYDDESFFLTLHAARSRRHRLASGGDQRFEVDGSLTRLRRPGAHRVATP
jgi:hypothetical protein